MNKKLKLFLFICIPVFLIAVIIAGVIFVPQIIENRRVAREAALTESELYQIEQMHNTFYSSDSREVRLSILHDLENFQIESYDGFDYVYEALYLVIPQIQNWFYEDYRGYIELHAYTIENTYFDIHMLQSKISNLEEFIEQIAYENISGIDSESVIESTLDEIAFLEYLDYQVGVITNLDTAFESATSREERLALRSELVPIVRRRTHFRIRDITPYVNFVEDSNGRMQDWFAYDYSNTYTQIRLQADTLLAGSAITQGQATEVIDELRDLLILIRADNVLVGSDSQDITDNINLLFSEIAHHVDRQPPLVSWMRENSGEIVIHGNERFQRRINQALDIIRRHPEYYEMVNTYLDLIRPGDDAVNNGVSYVFVYPVPTTGIGRRCLGASRTWLAGIIVHEAYHSKLFWEYYNTYNRWPDPDIYVAGLGHLKVFEVQNDFLRAARAPQHYIPWTRQQSMIPYYRRLCDYRRGIDSSVNCCGNFRSGFVSYALNNYPVLHRDPLPARFRVAPEEMIQRDLRLSLRN